MDHDVADADDTAHQELAHHSVLPPQGFADEDDRIRERSAQPKSAHVQK